jgi:hypothetical protein
MTTAARDGRGRRRVTLYVPVEGQSPQPLTEIVFAPVTAELMWRWEDGKVDGVVGLMCELSGWSRDWIGAIQYPDYEYVVQEFMAHLPARLRTSIANGEIPLIADEPEGPKPNGADGDAIPMTSPDPIEVEEITSGRDEGLGFGGLDPG